MKTGNEPTVCPKYAVWIRRVLGTHNACPHVSRTPEPQPIAPGRCCGPSQCTRVAEQHSLLEQEGWPKDSHVTKFRSLGMKIITLTNHIKAGETYTIQPGA